MAEAKSGSIVKIHYTGKLRDGTPFDTSRGREPLEFRVGAGEVIAGVDREVVGMSEGETKTFDVDAADGYGPHRGELVAKVPKNRLPDGMKFEVGQRLQVNLPSGGESMVVRVTGVEDDAVTIDGNHALAGKDLTFEVEMVEVGEQGEGATGESEPK